MRSLKLSIPIDELPDWHFATGGLPGVSDEDLRYLEAGALPDVYVDAIARIACEEVQKLSAMAVPGVEPWMSAKRRSN